LFGYALPADGYRNGDRNGGAIGVNDLGGETNITSLVAVKPGKSGIEGCVPETPPGAKVEILLDSQNVIMEVPKGDSYSEHGKDPAEYSPRYSVR
jgi:hypothetical protein